MPVATPADVAAALGRDLTLAEQTSVIGAIASSIETIEAKLHRTIHIDQWVETRTPLIEGMSRGSVSNGFSIIGTGQARVHLKHRPVATLVSIVDQRSGYDLTTSSFLDGDSVYVPTAGPVTITYVAGDDPPSPSIKRILVRAIVRELSLPTAVATGAYSSYSVEGSSFAADRPADDATYPFNKSEMATLRTTLGRTIFR